MAEATPNLSQRLAERLTKEDQVAGRSKKVKEQAAANPQPSSLEGASPEAPAQAAAVQPPSELPAEVMYVQLRADHRYLHGMTSLLLAGQILSSQDYDFEKLKAQGAQLDLIDLETREVLANLNEL